MTQTKPAALAATLAVILLAGAALAQTATAPDPAIDTDGDGLYSFPEMTAHYTEMTAEEFTMVDANGDGLLDMEEVSAATDAGLLPVTDG